tara:strand:- start:479 stop:928 length:450 start_codon:yes stop_codon:yes gene_type:complete
MAIVSEVERNCETAWIAALQAHTDLTDIEGMTVVRSGDADTDADYPVVVVQASSAFTPAEFQNIGVDRITVDISARTFKHDDPSRTTVDQAIGAVRDLFRDETIETNLSGQVVNFTVKGIEESEPAVLIDDPDVHIRTMTSLITAIATD